MNEPVCLSLLSKLESAAGVRLPHKERVERSLEVFELAPGEFAFRQGDRARGIYVVRRGLLKQYYVDTDGHCWIKSFTPENSAFACVEALESNSPASFASQAIEHSIVERVPYSVVEELARLAREWERARTVAYTTLARIKVRRERDLLMLSPEQLYEQFAATAPELSERIPQKDLASYLGVTPVGLNRIIKRCKMRQASSR